MSHLLNVYPEQQLVVILYSGEVTLAEFGEVAAEMLSHPAYRIWFDGVSDFRQAHTTMSADELEALAEAALKDDAAKGKWCFIISPSDPMATAFSMIYQERLENQHDSAAVTTLEGASEFLSRDLTQFLPLVRERPMLRKAR